MQISLIIVTFNLLSIYKTTLAASPAGDVVGKLTVGYQGWFAAKGDGSPLNRWIHWSNNGDVPSPGHLKFEIWPDVREYTNTYQTGFANLGNGQPAKLFSSYDDQVVETHFKWMQQYGIDTAAHQRFRPNINSPPEKAQLDGVSLKVKNGAEKHNRKFYVMYDVTDWKDFHTEIKSDWTNTIVNQLHLTNSSAYAKQNGKPVVCIWGFGFDDRPGTAAETLDVINFFKGQGLYVIGGVPKHWRTGQSSRPNFMGTYTAFNMISPWTVGSMGKVSDAIGYQEELKADFAFCNSHNMDYQPVMFAGSAWSNMHPGPRNENPRQHGDFMWQQFVNFRQAGITSAYLAMFDEYDEGTAIAKAAEDKSMMPTNQYFLSYDADGVHVSGDFYMRLAGDGARMLKGEIPLQTTHPTKHVA